MARTKASVGAKISSGKSSKARCSAAPMNTGNSSGGSDRSSRSHGGGNPVCPREIPKWQKSITNFLVCKNTSQTESVDDDEVLPEKVQKKPRRPIIESDTEMECEEIVKNTELDDSILLEPLTGEECHKIEEYYPKKGESKSQKQEIVTQVEINGERRGSGKREFDGNLEDITQNNKKMKIK